MAACFDGGAAGLLQQKHQMALVQKLTQPKKWFVFGWENGKDSFAEEGTGLVRLLLHFSTTPNIAAI